MAEVYLGGDRRRWLLSYYAKSTRQAGYELPEMGKRALSSRARERRDGVRLSTVYGVDPYRFTQDGPYVGRKPVGERKTCLLKMMIMIEFDGYGEKIAAEGQSLGDAVLKVLVFL